MEPASKNWLYELLQHTEQSISSCSTAEIEQLFFQEHTVQDFTYRILHSTGVVYSYPLGLYVKDHPQIADWGDADLMKVVFADMMINISIFSHRDQLRDQGFASILSLVLADLDQYYTQLVAEDDQPFSLRIFPPQETARQRIERYLNRRVASKSFFTRGFWSGVMSNAFLFLDAVIFCEYLENGKQRVPKEQFQVLKKAVIEISLCAIHANGRLEPTEETLFKFFLESAELTEYEERFYANLLTKGMTTLGLQVPRNLPSLQKKVVMEMCIVAAMADSHFGYEETHYINEIADRLNMSKGELEQSIIFTEGFLLKNAGRIVYLQNSSTLSMLGRSLNSRVWAMMKKNRANIRREISESRELMELMWKSQNESLTPEEREKVKTQLADLIKTIPSLAIFMVPGGSVLLPLLLRFLPDEMVKPSSFRNSAADGKL